MDKEKWIKDIESKMDGFEMPPPQGLWEDIERQVHPELAKSKIVRMHHRRTWTAAAVLAGTLVTGGGVWFASHQEDSPVSPSTLRTQVAQTKDGGSQQPSEVNTTQEASQQKDETVHIIKSYHMNDVFLQTTGKDTLPTTEPQKTVDIAEQVEQKTASEPAQKSTSQPTQKTQGKQPTRREGSYTSPSWDDQPLLASRQPREDKVSVALTASNFMSSSSQRSGYGELMVGSVWQGNDNGEENEGNDASDDFGALDEVILGNYTRQTYTKKKHRQPIKIGLSVNYRLSDRWAVGTGLTYSYLSSELTSGSDGAYYTTQQKLQYVGIPLNLSYTFYHHKRWSLYGTTGGMIEKCVKGKSSTAFIINGNEIDCQSDEIKEKRLQYSVGAAVGVQAEIVDHVGFYLEPGISYHFDNHSEVVNIYKDKPLNFSIGLGFRYSF